MSNRIGWVDSLKFVGMLVVVLGHMNSPFGVTIYKFHMPLFFMIAGFFIHWSQSFGQSVRKDFRRLMVPYFTFAFLGLLSEWLKRFVLHRDPIDLLINLKGIVWDMDIAGLGKHYGFVLWFLPALFFARTFLHLLNQVLPRIWILVPISVLLFLVSFKIELPFGLDNAFLVMPWVLFGSYFYRFCQKKTIPPVLFTGCLGICIFLSISPLDIANKVYPNLIANTLWALAAVCSVTFILQKISLTGTLRDIAEQWGKETMLIFVLHPYTNNIAYLISEQVHHGLWMLELVLSCLLLQSMLWVKSRHSQWGVFRYV
jgi:acyltransferase